MLALIVGFGSAELLVVLVLVAGMTFAITALRRGAWRGRRPDRRHLVTRIVCGTLGAAILVAVGVGTWVSVRRLYAPQPAGNVTIRVPTKEPPALPNPRKPGHREEVESARILFHLVVGEPAPEGFTAVHVEEIDVRWPRDNGRPLAASFDVGGYDCSFQLHVAQLFVRQKSKDDIPCLEPQGSLRFSYRHGRGSGSSSRGLYGMDAAYVDDLSPLVPAPDPLSISPGGTARRTLLAIGFMTRVAEDDPLKAVPFDSFAASRPAEVAEILGEAGRRSPRYGASRIDDIPARGFALAGHIGVSSLLLLASAILLTQLFRRRGLAFAGVLAAVILYVAALERAALGVHVSRLSDPKAALASRLTACEMAPQTFFHAERAYAALLEVAKDESAPRPLRSTAAGSARDLFPGRALPAGIDPS